MDWVAGVDGCPGGWVVALEDLDSGEVRSAWGATFADVLALPQRPRIVGVDVPIGLLPGAEPGGRACDREAIKLLGRRGSSVFSPPSRPALDALRAGNPYAAVSAANRTSSTAGIGLSKQTFGIMPKIADVDDVMTSALQDRVFEVHPEVAFSRANGWRLLPSKKRGDGRSTRQRTLAELGYPSLEGWFLEPRPRRSRVDDLLDACITCWTAKRIARGEAQRVPAAPPRDPRGLRMEIWS
jgi:predicted RNase H-like nuclease